MNKRLLRAKIIESGHSADEIAKYLGICTASFYGKLNSGKFWIKEVNDIANLLKINNSEDIYKIFFD